VEKVGQRKKKHRRPKLGIYERRGIRQLGFSLALFLVVFLGRGAFPLQTQVWRKELLEVIQRDMDVSRVLTGIECVVSKYVSVEEIGEVLWPGALGTQEHFAAPSNLASVPRRLGYGEEGGEPLCAKPMLAKQVQLPEEPVLPAEEQTPVQRDLGLMESVSPVMGVLTSGYGMRMHPIFLENRMHDGIDLAADTGTPIRAFADGTVDYIGESNAYGMYLQLRHENGVTSFYAHCSELCVQKGKKVKVGDVIAKVGNTGISTGPHLHLEIKKNGVRIDPLPYVEYLLG